MNNYVKCLHNRSQKLKEPYYYRWKYRRTLDDTRKVDILDIRFSCWEACCSDCANVMRRFLTDGKEHDREAQERVRVPIYLKAGGYVHRHEDIKGGSISELAGQYLALGLMFASDGLLWSGFHRASWVLGMRG